MKEKDYVAVVKVEWTQCLSADSKKKAREAVKNIFEDEFGFRPTNKEIISLEENKKEE